MVIRLGAIHALLPEDWLLAAGDQRREMAIINGATKQGEAVLPLPRART
jgi:hypothetical protein